MACEPYTPISYQSVSLSISTLIRLSPLNSYLTHFDEVRHCQKGYFDIPQAIISNPACDKGTGLPVFYRLRGLNFLYEKGVTLSMQQNLGSICCED
ncbi:DUF4274 domain-containing protein [Paenibacillus sp. FSL R5-0527]|uniref:DUF4274 domain-containing protein n=1 Tax=Paenibacillus sp. FSL R5-0527 TaxID=2975321 RepID=UPI004047FCC6